MKKIYVLLLAAAITGICSAHELIYLKLMELFMATILLLSLNTLIRPLSPLRWAKLLVQAIFALSLLVLVALTMLWKTVKLLALIQLTNIAKISYCSIKQL